MLSKLAGHLPLADMISQVIDDSRSKLAESEGGEKVKKLLKYEKKEHGHVPSVKEEEEEKKASAIDYSDPEEVEKLASALDQVGEMFMKSAADGQEHGGEYKGGGETLAVMKPVSGKQSYKKDSSKAHNVPMSTGLQSDPSQGKASTQVPNDHAKAPGGAPYPKKGVMKTASEGVLDKIRAAAAPKKDEKVIEVVDFPKKDEEAEDSEEKPKAASVQALEEAVVKMKVAKGLPPALAENAKKVVKAQDPGKPGAEKPDLKKDDEKGEKEEKGEKDDKEKESSVGYILSKMAEGEVERRMGGETLDSKSGDGPKPPTGGTNSARSMIESNSAATNAKKVQTKAPQKKLMSQVLTEPALSKAHDSKVHENLRNASKGGVKIAAARELLKKIAAEGCTCDGKGTCKHCKMKKAMEKKSQGLPMSGGMGGSSGAGSSMPGPMM